MARNNKSKEYVSHKVLVILSTLFVTSAVGSTTGTLAWFEYSTRAKMAYHGTAVGELDSLRIGIYSEADLPLYRNYGLVQDANDEHIYWSRTSLDAATLTYYSEVNGYASNDLGPISAGAFEEGGTFELKEAPTALVSHQEIAQAKRRNYLHLPLVFGPGLGSTAVHGQHAVVLTEAEIEKSTGFIKDAMRIHFSSNVANFIFNPNSEPNGQDVVGGVLDLNHDGFYDHEKIDGLEKEFVYGQIIGEPIYKTEPSLNKTPMDVEKRSTFYSAHAYDVYELDTEKTQFQTSDWEGRQNTILKKQLAVTSGGTNNIARLDVDIYVEGWSPYVIDENINNMFDLKLSFELEGKND